MSTFKYSGWILIGLCLLMLMTRFDHFGSVTTLPDASLAIFFFGGLYLRSVPWFILLLVEAALIDFVAIQYGGVNDNCITPAYAFLIPTYGVLWLSGYFSSRYNLFSVRDMMISGIMLVAAVSMAFMISNASFYLFSGHFTHMNWSEYVSSVAQYYSSYLLSTLIYASIIVMIHVASRYLVIANKGVGK